MKALIIAAGEGTRLNRLTEDKPKPLIQLLGLSLIERVLLTAKQAGIGEFFIVVGHLGDMIISKLGDGSRYGVEINYIENKEWPKGNGVSVLNVREFLDENFILMMSDHIFDARILSELLDYDGRSAVVLAVDRREPLTGDTKVLEKNGRIVDIGEDIENQNGIDTGIFLCSPEIFSYIEEAVQEGNTELADGIAEAARNEDAEIFDITRIESYASKMRKEIKPWWIDVDTEEDLRRAKDYYIHKPVENKLVAFISNFDITHNQLTISSNILAYTVTALFLFGYLLPASILTFVVGIVDGLDGKLARVKLKTSNWFLFSSTRSATPLILCIFIIFFVAFYRHVYDQFRRAAGKSLDDAGNFERIFRRVAGRRNLYNIPIFVSIIFGVLLYSLFFIAFHSGITAVVYASSAIKHLYVADREKIR
jgi:CDP-L-myo-inositol myo-inositolphosphotransferase